MLKGKYQLLILVVVIVVGAFLRLYKLEQFPPSLNWDEVSLGYNANSLLNSGRDEWGVVLPTIFRAFGDYKLPVYVYLTVVSQSLLGLTALGVKLPSVMAGLGLIVVAYAVGAKFFSRQVGLWSAILVAISPWTVFLSRVAVEANVGAFLVAIGMYFLLTKKYFRAAVLLGLSVWAYNSARVFVPLVFVAYWLTQRKHLKIPLLAVGTGLALLVPMFWQLLHNSGQARYRWLAILNEGGVAEINQLRGDSTWPADMSRLVYNKGTYFTWQFGRNYLSYLSPQFLFFTGGSHYQFSIPGEGLLYLSTLPLVIIGLGYLIYRRSWLVAWLLLSPVAGSITRDSPHVLRAIVMLPLPMIMAAVGLGWLVTKLQWRWLALALAVLLTWQTHSYWKSNYKYRLEYSWAWQYGYQQMVQFVKSNFDSYDQIVVTKRYGEPHEFFLYFWPWDSGQYRADANLNRYFRSDWYWVDSFSKFKFVNDWEMRDYTSNLSSGNFLIVASPDNEPAGEEVYRVNFLDNKPAFIVKRLER